MALQSCYECNKEISTKAIMCPHCGAPQNPVSGLVDKTLNVFKKFKNDRDRKKKGK
jgi:predicted amidophosphoribosyltransferase